MKPLAFAKTHHGLKDWKVHGVVRNTKNQIFPEWLTIKQKQFLFSASGDTL